jgi:hypothetical protein
MNLCMNDGLVLHDKLDRWCDKETGDNYLTTSLQLLFVQTWSLKQNEIKDFDYEQKYTKGQKCCPRTMSIVIPLCYWSFMR